MSVFIAQGEARSPDTPADLLIGWGKRGLRIHLLVAPPRGVGRSGPNPFPSRGQEGGGQVAQGGGRVITMRGVGQSFLSWPEASRSISLKPNIHHVAP